RRAIHAARPPPNPNRLREQAINHQGRSRHDRPPPMPPPSIDQINSQRCPDADDARGPTLREPMGADRHHESIDAEPPRLDIRRRYASRLTLGSHELGFGSMRMSSGVSEHFVHSSPTHSGNDDPIDIPAGPGAARPRRAPRPSPRSRTPAAGRKAKHPLREVPRLPPRKRLGELTPKPPILQPRPLDARIPNIDQQRAADRLRSPTPTAHCLLPRRAAPPPHRTTAPRAPATAPRRSQLVALTDTSPEINFFNPWGVSTSSAP